MAVSPLPPIAPAPCTVITPADGNALVLAGAPVPVGGAQLAEAGTPTPVTVDWFANDGLRPCAIQIGEHAYTYEDIVSEVDRRFRFARFFAWTASTSTLAIGGLTHLLSGHWYFGLAGACAGALVLGAGVYNVLAHRWNKLLPVPVDGHSRPEIAANRALLKLQEQGIGGPNLTPHELATWWHALLRIARAVSQGMDEDTICLWHGYSDAAPETKKLQTHATLRDLIDGLANILVENTPYNLISIMSLEPFLEMAARSSHGVDVLREIERRRPITFQDIGNLDVKWMYPDVGTSRFEENVRWLIWKGNETVLGRLYEFATDEKNKREWRLKCGRLIEKIAKGGNEHAKLLLRVHADTIAALY